MTTRLQLAYERRGALASARAIAALRKGRTVAVDLALGMAEHEVRKLVQDYTRQLEQPEPCELQLEPTEGATR